MEADLPTIRRQGYAEVLRACRPYHVTKSIHDSQLLVDSVRRLRLPCCLALLLYRSRPISGVPPPSELANPPIPASKLTTPLSLHSSGSSQTPLGSPTPRPWWQSCYRSVRTPAHVYGSDPLSPPQREDPSQRHCRIAAQNGQCDAATSPSTTRLGFPLPGSLPRASRIFTSSEAALELT